MIIFPYKMLSGRGLSKSQSRSGQFHCWSPQRLIHSIFMILNIRIKTAIRQVLILFTGLTALTIQPNSQTLKPHCSQHPLQSQSGFLLESQRSLQIN
jgi:hypothetical protein